MGDCLDIISVSGGLPGSIQCRVISYASETDKTLIY